MKTTELQQVISWLKTTDLVEVAFRDGSAGFSLASSEGSPLLPATGLECRYAPVSSPGVGFFQWGEAGRPRRVEEGSPVKEGEILGIVEQGKGHSLPVKASCAGRVARIFVEGGAAVEFGQPIVFIEAA